MTAHTKEQREFIALRLARFEMPPEIIAAFQVRFPDTHCTPDDVASCDPRQGGILAPETWEKFKAERERVLVDPASAPAADRRVRLLILNQELERHRARGATLIVQSILEQIAEETKDDGAPGGAGMPAAGEVRRINRTIVDPKAPSEAA